jgi:mitogen-activated protein kinase 15
MSKEIESHVLEMFEVSSFIGSGAYGHVWKVVYRPTGKLYALKKIFDAFQNDVDAQRTYREISILHQLDHPNIVKLQWAIRAHNPRDIYLVFEWAEADLHSLLGYLWSDLARTSSRALTSDL